MTPEQRAGIEARHGERDHVGHCFDGFVIDGAYKVPYQCDTTVLLAALAEAEQRAEVAEADAVRLSAALRREVEMLDTMAVNLRAARGPRL